MDFKNLFGIIVILAVFAVFVSAIIEVIKGISAIGIKGLIADLFKTLWGNTPMRKDAFPVLNFAVALLCCYAFNVTVMSVIFNSLLSGQHGTYTQVMLAQWIDYFGTASVTYMGSDQLFKRFLDVKNGADAFISASETQDK